MIETSSITGVTRRWFESGWTAWPIFLLGWTLLSLMFVPEVYLYFLYRGEQITWGASMVLALANAAIAFLFLPAIVWLARRVPVERETWPRALLIHVPACLVFALSHSGLYAALCYASPSVFHTMFLRFHPNLLTYWAVVGFTQAVDYFRRYRERERQLAQAELLLLKAQLHPHFLFNTLHTIAAMMRVDVDAAERTIARLSELLRLVLDQVGIHEVPLRQELEFIDKYVAIQRVRRGDDVRLVVSVAPDALDALVPTMVLQPLVENAFRHGFDAQAGGGAITITAGTLGNQVTIAVSDTGAGLCSVHVAERVGLTNTRLRLRELYGIGYEFHLEANTPKGCRAILRIPYRHPEGIADQPPIEWREYEDSGADRRRRAVGAKTPVVSG
jgi:two-component system LytT family sensor kinase